MGFTIERRDDGTLCMCSSSQKSTLETETSWEIPVHRYSLDTLRDRYCLCEALVTSSIFEYLRAKPELWLYGSGHLFCHLGHFDFLLNHHVL